MSTLEVAELTLFAHPAEYLRQRGELRMTTLQVVWYNGAGAAVVNIPWAQISKDQYSKYNPAKAVDVVSVALTTVAQAKPVVFTLLGSSESSRRELERLKVVVRDAVKSSSRKRGSSRLAWLEADKALFKEYVELVRDGKVIDEEDFWRDKEAMLSGFDSARAVSEKGTVSALFADEAAVDCGGKMKVKINPEIIHNIFRLYPAVAKAYSENVPDKMSEKEFWTKYFRSEYYARDKGSSAPDLIGGRRQPLRQTDDIFQRCENEMTVAAIGATAAAGAGPRRLGGVHKDTDLVSTYNDFHSSEQLESFDLPTDTSSNPIVNKYIRNTNLVVDSVFSFNVADEGDDGDETTLRIAPASEFIEMPQLHARLDSLVKGDHQDVDEQPAKRLKRSHLSPDDILIGMNSIFQDSKVDGGPSSSLLSAANRQSQDQQLYIELVSFPEGFREVVSAQFEHITQLLRHFYAFFLTSSSWEDPNTIAKMKKILNLLEDKQTAIGTLRKELQSKSSSTSDPNLLRFQFRCLTELLHPVNQAFEVWDRTCTEKNISSVN